MPELQGTLQEARKVIGAVAMGDLLGASEPPPGVPDNYPFNACKWRDAYPVTYKAALEEVLAFVYHNDDLPPDMRAGDGADDPCQRCGINERVRDWPQCDNCLNVTGIADGALT